MRAQTRLPAQFRSGVHAQSVEDVAPMPGHGQWADVELAAYLLSAAPYDYERCDLALPDGEAAPAGGKSRGWSGFRAEHSSSANSTSAWNMAAAAESWAAVVKWSLRRIFTRCLRKVK